jgi:anti-anti-sigma factor
VQSDLTVSVRRQGESAIVEVGGELDLGSSAQLEQALQLAWRDEPALVVIELGELYFIDMAGLRVLLEAQRRAAERDTRLLLAHVRRPVQRVLELARMRHLFTIQENHG